MSHRHEIGFAAAALCVAVGSGVEQGWSLVSWVLFGVAVAVVAVAFADQLFILHKLPQPWGAIKPPFVEAHIDGRQPDDLTFQMAGDGPENALVHVGFRNDNFRPIREVVLNVYVLGSSEIERREQNGEPWDGEGKRLVGEGPYWAQGNITISRAVVMSFRVSLPRPGRYKLVVAVESPDFYVRRDIYFSDDLPALGPGDQPDDLSDVRWE